VLLLIQINFKINMQNNKSEPEYKQIQKTIQNTYTTTKRQNICIQKQTLYTLTLHNILLLDLLYLQLAAHITKFKQKNNFKQKTNL